MTTVIQVGRFVVYSNSAPELSKPRGNLYLAASNGVVLKKPVRWYLAAIWHKVA